MVEAQAFGDAPTDGDDAVIARTLTVLNLDWTAAELAGHRHTARLLVEKERQSIEVLADALLHHRYLTADDIGVILSISAGTVPVVGAPIWIS